MKYTVIENTLFTILLPKKRRETGRPQFYTKVTRSNIVFQHAVTYKTIKGGQITSCSLAGDSESKFASCLELHTMY